jgi:hypothetical protein
MNFNFQTALRGILEDVSTIRNVSSKQVLKYFATDIKKISSVELNRLSRTYLTTKNEAKRQAINVLMTKRANHNAHSTNDNTASLPLEVKRQIDKSFYQSVLNSSNNNLFRTPEIKEVLQHFGCYGVALAERTFAPKNANDVKKLKDFISEYAEWVGIERSAIGKSGLQAQILQDVSKQNLDRGYRQEARTQLNHAINLEVEKRVNDYLSNLASDKGYRLPNGSLMTKENIDQWLTVRLEKIGESQA